MIVGIDEVGRGAWSGPLCVGAVALGGNSIAGITDSKLLSKKKRQQYALQIRQSAPLIGIGWVSALDIDKIGMSAALKLASSRAFAQIDSSEIEQIIIDGTIMLIDDPRATTLKKADLLVPSVSAASIIAKVARDEYMAQCDALFPGYGWATNVGYGAKKHQDAINLRGTTPLHRMSFAPMKVLEAPKKVIQSSTTKFIGDCAESSAATFLISRGYKIIDRNWRMKWCEIDIIASSSQGISFVEVKYRKNDHQGGGLAAITLSKIRQMEFAAKIWMQTHNSDEVRLSAIQVQGNDFAVTEFISEVRR